MKYLLMKHHSYLIMAVLMAAVMIMPSTSHAFGGDGGDGGNASSSAQAGAVAGAAAGAFNKNNISNKQGQKQGQAQGQLQGQKQSTSNANNSKQQVNVAGDNYEAPEIPVSTAYAPTINPTATCMGSTTGGGQGLNIGFTIGTSWESKNCMILETARSFEQAGYTKDALAIRCTTKYAAAAPSCKALTEGGKVAKSASKPAKSVDAEIVAAVEVEPTVAIDVTQVPVKSDNGYYSVVTNPLAQ